MLALALVPAFGRLGGGLFGLAVAVDLLLLLLVAVDGMLAARPSDLDVMRRHPRTGTQTAATAVSLDVGSRARRTARLRLHDATPASFVAEGARLDLVLSARAAATIGYRVCPKRRGDHGFGGVHVQSFGPLGLFRRIAFLPIATTMRIYPRLEGRASEGIAGRKVMARMVGRRRARFAGMGREFEALRGYVPGDPLRHVDWKVSARRGALVTREYAPERDQTLVLLVDSGRMMGTAVGDRSKLDHALSAALALAQAAIAAGDLVSMVIFSRAIHAFLAPGRGVAWLRQAMEASAQIEADRSEPDYARTYAQMRRRIPHRALVVTFTDIADSAQSRDLVTSNMALRPRYLPLLVTFRDPELDRLASRVPRTVAELYEKAAAAEDQTETRRTLRRLEGQGALTLEVPAERITAEVLRRYLTLKFAGRL